jgi:Golgi SNAP receptor complex protein 1
MSTFNSVRPQALSLETQTATLLSKYSSFAMSPSSSATAEELKMERQVESVLQKREELLDNLSRISDTTPSLPTVKLQQLIRHKEILQENWKQFIQLRSSITSERNKLNLLFNVNKSLDERKNIDEMDYINEESQRVNGMNNVTDDLIQRAYETRDSLLNQRSVLQRSSNKLLSTLGNIPGVNSLISKINTRRKRDAVILGLLISVCILLLWWTL